MAMQILLFLVNILLTPCLPPLLCAAPPVDSKISGVIFFFSICKRDVRCTPSVL